ncbi:hypothetical protein VTK73DRAFT_10289 [Phialemonium thermophilum]|uniref:Uncharacterized protein n=1 Tax=Phialemonium thermophilum TaxID=223376 RepID=A0ABR3VXI3_9PEZI
MRSLQRRRPRGGRREGRRRSTVGVVGRLVEVVGVGEVQVAVGDEGVVETDVLEVADVGQHGVVVVGAQRVEGRGFRGFGGGEARRRARGRGGGGGGGDAACGAASVDRRLHVARNTNKQPKMFFTCSRSSKAAGQWAVKQTSSLHGGPGPRCAVLVGWPSGQDEGWQDRRYELAVGGWRSPRQRLACQTPATIKAWSRPKKKSKKKKKIWGGGWARGWRRTPRDGGSQERSTRDGRESRRDPMGSPRWWNERVP